MADQYDIIIVGGGISGLSLAHYCAKDRLKTLVLEKSDRFGGALHSHVFEEKVPPYWTELGAHTLYNSYQNLIGLLEDQGILSHVMKRGKAPFKMILDDRMVSIPSQLSFAGLFFSLARSFGVKKEGKTVEEYYSTLLGRTNYDRVLRHMFAAVVSQDPDNFSAEMLFKKRSRRKDVLKKFTFPGGIQTIVDSLAAADGVEARTSETITGIELRDDGAAVTTASGKFEAPWLALATPADVSSDLLRRSAPQIAEKLRGIRVARVETLAVAVEKDAVRLPIFANAVGVQDVFYSIVSRDTVPDAAHRGFTFHFRPDTLDEEGKLNRVSRVLGITRRELGKPVFKNNFLPTLTLEAGKAARKIDALLPETPLLLTGNYFSGMAIEDCVSRSLSEFRRMKAKAGGRR